MSDLSSLLESLQTGTLKSAELARMEKEGTLSKTERRKVVKKFKKLQKMTPRMIQRREAKEKKNLPKLSKDERRKKYVDNTIEEERLAFAAARTVCLGCREKGHYLKDCPNVSKNTLEIAEVCFNCGETDHPLRACPHPRDGRKLPYAKCFVCKKTGHISKECPENANGLYPKGGCCHICFQKTHLVRDCPDRTEEEKERHKLEREALKERELGPKVKGLLNNNESSLGADEIVSLETEEEAVGIEDEENSDHRKESLVRKKKRRKFDS